MSNFGNGRSMIHASSRLIPPHFVRQRMMSFFRTVILRGGDEEGATVKRGDLSREGFSLARNIRLMGRP